jgi:hypothetical protein
MVSSAIHNVPEKALEPFILQPAGMQNSSDFIPRPPYLDNLLGERKRHDGVL